MAAKTVEVEELMNTVLVCDVCMEPFDSGTRVPLLLPCRHSFCLSCLESLSKGGDFRCPICRHLVPVSGPVSTSLPKDIISLKVVDYLTMKSAAQKVPCTDCVDKNTAGYRCLTCHLNLCQACQDGHRRLPFCRSHTVRSLEELAAAPGDFLAEVETCGEHVGVALNLYCDSQACKVALCTSCAMVAHRQDSHSIMDLSKAHERAKKEHTDLLALLEKEEERKTGILNDVKKKTELVETSAATASDQVNQAMDRLLEAVEERRKQLLEEVRQTKDRQTAELKKMEEETSSHVSQIQEATGYLRRAERLSRQAEFISVVHAQGPSIRKLASTDYYATLSKSFSGDYPGLSFFPPRTDPIQFEAGDEETTAKAVLTLGSVRDRWRLPVSAKQTKCDPEQPKAKPFANFSFTPPTTTQTSAVTPAASTPARTLGFGGTPSCGSLAAFFAVAPAFLTKSPQEGVLSAGHTLFQKQTPVRSPSKDGEDEKVNEYEPNVDFKPVIALPELVPTLTGEENEEKVFGERARLFRFDSDTSQWKERGIGELKILRTPSTNQVRILMRREQVLKVCANHKLTRDMRLTPMPSSDRAWCWAAMDYAEETLQMEKFAAQFKTPELALVFKEKFDACQRMPGEGLVKGEPKAKDKKPTFRFGAAPTIQSSGFTFGSAATPSQPSQSTPLYELLKRDESSWECSGCLLSNKADLLQCPACQGLKPVVKPEDVKDTVSGVKVGSAAAPSRGFQFGSAQKGAAAPAQTGGFQFGSAQKSSEAPAQIGGFQYGSGGGFQFGAKTASPAPGASQASSAVQEAESRPVPKNSGNRTLLEQLQADDIGMKPDATSTPVASASTPGTAAAAAQSKPAESKGFSFSMPGGSGDSKGFQFKTALSSPASGFKFRLDDKNSSAGEGQEKAGDKRGFTFNKMPASTPSKDRPLAATPTTTPKFPLTEEGDYYVKKDREGSHIYFEPVIPLPDKVEVRTGEEDEDVMYEHRAKLFRFVNGEWRERGLGIVKVLQHKTTDKCRLLMRREQVLKICLNHAVTPDLELRPMPKAEGKAWVWMAQDYAEEQPRVENFSIRFKTAEFANSFKQAVDAAREKKRGLQGFPVGKATSQSPETWLFKGDEGLTGKVEGGKEDVVVVKVEQASPEQVAQARHFQLPDHFYLYLQRPPCPGCIGCEDYVPPPTFGPFTGVTVGQGLSFADLAKIGADTSGFTQKADTPFQWASAGQKLFGGDKAPQKQKEVRPSDDVYFKPAIPLPPLVERKSGEEGWTPIYSQRCRLYRYDNASNQWKERGIGEMKILKDEKEYRYRLLMRREQVLKVACNQMLTSDLALKPLATSETTWCWVATDFSEGKVTEEKFALKFKNTELAKAFYEVVSECQATLAVIGEKGWTRIYCQNCTLFRIDHDTNKWKEHATGEMKIYKENNQSRYRLLMQDERTLKLICNQRLTSSLTLRSLGNLDTACVWVATDFSDGQPRTEKFSIKFKNTASAKEFHHLLMECKAKLPAVAQ